MTTTKIKRALISVSNKEGVDRLAKYLTDQGVEVLSTGGTAKLLKNMHDDLVRAYSMEINNNNKNNNNDGDGVEQARYNCYDAAGYTNVNQCYKFESKTSMAIAEPEDMARASEQGSILLIKAYGNVYGEGGYVSPPESDLQAAIYISLAVSAACGIIMGVGCIVRRCCCRATVRQ